MKRTLLFVIFFLPFILVNNCSPNDDNSDIDNIILSPASPVKVEVNIGEKIDLSAIVLRQQSGAVEGTSVKFTPVGIMEKAGHSVSPTDCQTDSKGLCRTTFYAGTQTGDFQVEVSLNQSGQTEEVLPQPIRFTITVKQPVRVLQADGPDSIDSVINARVRLAVIAKTDSGRTLSGETINWQILSGGEGGATLSETTNTTIPTGQAIVTLRNGNTPTTIKIQASMEGTTPVTLTVYVKEKGTGQCKLSTECLDGYVCEDGVCNYVEPECYINDDCTETANDECRFGKCVSPDITGYWCEFDTECSENYLCVGGYCTLDPRYNDGCETLNNCPFGYICVDNKCVSNPDNPDPECIADEDCDQNMRCENGECIDPNTCGNDPNLEGTWQISSQYRFREALPDWVAGLMDALGVPFRFLSEGILNGFEFNIPEIGEVLEEAANAIVSQFIPPWIGELLGAIATLNDLLSTINVEEQFILIEMTSNQYQGEQQWSEVSFNYAGEEVTGNLSEITGVDVIPSDFNAQSVCGTFYVYNHEFSVAFGQIVRWMLDVIVTVVSEGEYFSMEELLLSLTEYCGDLAEAIEELAWELSQDLDIDLPDVYNTVLTMCTVGIEAGTPAAIEQLNNIKVTDDVIKLQGEGKIESATKLTNGHWYGELYGRDFTGSWSGEKW